MVTFKRVEHFHELIIGDEFKVVRSLPWAAETSQIGKLIEIHHNTRSFTLETESYEQRIGHLYAMPDTMIYGFDSSITVYKTVYGSQASQEASAYHNCYDHKKPWPLDYNRFTCSKCNEFVS